jgi:RNA polymerase sigma-70 factor (ECF subfamily)
MQECFLRLAKHLIDGGSDINLRAWLFQVAHNLSMDLHRAHDHTKPAKEPEGEVSTDLSDPTSNPEGIFLQEEAMRRMHIAMTQLSPKQRSGVLMRAQGLRYLEIASALKVSESRAIYLVKRGLTRLAVHL